MKQSILPQEELLRVLTKGMVTIPKNWREELGLKEGKFIKATKLQGKIVIESIDQPAPYRIYSPAELKQFIKDDRL